MRQVIIFVIVFVLGLGAGFFINKDGSSHETISMDVSELSETNKRLNEKIKELEKYSVEIANVDMQEYLALKDSEEKFKKADEILGKVMLLFLANMYIQMSAQVETFANTPSEDREWKPEKVETEKPQAFETEQKEKSFSVSESVPNSKLSLNADSSFKKIEKELSKVVFEEPKIVAAKARNLTKMTPLMRKLNGVYSGELRVVDQKKNKTYKDEVQLDVEMNDSKGTLSGRFVMKLIRDGHAYNSSNSTGGNSTIKTVDERPNELLFEVGRDSLLQVLYVKKDDFFVANYYDEGKLAGVAKLVRD